MTTKTTIKVTMGKKFLFPDDIYRKIYVDGLHVGFITDLMPGYGVSIWMGQRGAGHGAEMHWNMSMDNTQLISERVTRAFKDWRNNTGTK